MVDQSETPDPLIAGKAPARVVPAGRSRAAAKKAPAKKAAAKKAAAKKAPAKKAPAKQAAAKKAPAKKAPAKKASAKKAPAKKAPAQQAAAKKAPAKQAAAKKAPAKQAPAKKAPAKKAPTKRAAAKKAPAKKAAAKTAPAEAVAATRSADQQAPSTTASSPLVDRTEPRVAEAIRSVARDVAAAAADVAAVIAPIGDSVAPVVAAISRPAAPAVGVPDDEPLRAGGSRSHDRWALCASITEELLNDLVLMAVGEGRALDPLDTTVTLPGMGEVEVRLALTVNGGTFRLSAEDGGRARIVITADGDVQTRSASYDGEADTGSGLGAPMGIPTPPAPIPVRVEALVHPFVEVHADHSVALGLDLAAAELVSLEADSSAPVPDGVDPTAWAGILQMFGMVFGVLGHGLFASLGEHVGTVGAELGPEVGEALIELGVEPGRADVNVGSGLLSFGLAASDAVRGRAQPVPIAGRRIGIGMANSVVEHLTHKLLERFAGNLPLPFELDVDLGEQRVGGRLRQSRLLPDPFPDLRSSLRTEIRPRLLRGKLELSVQAAWLELPPAMPSFFNQVSRRLGELVSLTPMRVQIPARLELPLIPAVPDTVPVEIDDLRITTNGIGVVVAIV